MSEYLPYRRERSNSVIVPKGEVDDNLQDKQAMTVGHFEERSQKTTEKVALIAEKVRFLEFSRKLYFFSVSLKTSAELRFDSKPGPWFDRSRWRESTM